MENINKQSTENERRGVLVRLPEDVIQRIDAEAKRAKRSRNAQVQCVLEEYYGVAEQAAQAA